jgi:hypothetical protein
VRALIVTVGVAVLAASAPAIERSRAVVAEFRRANPCPSTGKIRGACPGYQVDHREALICGGRDSVDNLQWLSIEEHKAKTRVEVKLCRSRRR